MIFSENKITVYLPKTITNVILIVLTLALGISPLELARLQSSPSSAIFLRLASVRGTENINITVQWWSGGGVPGVENVYINIAVITFTFASQHTILSVVDM